MYDGGPAYPFIEKNYIGDGMHEESVTTGMSLRDYFAGQALNWLQKFRYINKKGILSETNTEYLSKDAYQIADAMLNEREKEV